MPVGHTVKIGNDWLDGFQIGRAAALSEWAIRKEIDDPDFKRLCGGSRASVTGTATRRHK